MKREGKLLILTAGEANFVGNTLYSGWGPPPPPPDPYPNPAPAPPGPGVSPSPDLEILMAVADVLKIGGLVLADEPAPAATSQ